MCYAGPGIDAQCTVARGGAACTSARGLALPLVVVAPQYSNGSRKIKPSTNPFGWLRRSSCIIPSFRELLTAGGHRLQHVLRLELLAFGSCHQTVYTSASKGKCSSRKSRCGTCFHSLCKGLCSGRTCHYFEAKLVVRDNLGQIRHH